MEEYGTAGQVTDDNMNHAHCMLEQTLGYVTLIAFPVQQWLHERALMLSLHVRTLLVFFVKNCCRRDCMVCKGLPHLIEQKTTNHDF
jgi:hypothetical protein